MSFCGDYEKNCQRVQQKHQDIAIRRTLAWSILESIYKANALGEIEVVSDLMLQLAVLTEAAWYPHAHGVAA